MTLTLVCVADTHMFHDDFKSFPDGDVLVHAGDLTRQGSAKELATALAFFTALPHRHKVFVAGNHDWLFAREPERARELMRGVTYLEDSGAEVAGLRFWGSPWQPQYGGWAFNLPRGPALAEKWARIPDNVEVLVTHGPPFGVLDDAAAYRHGLLAGSGDWHEGCSDLGERVRQVRPRVHIFGHMHGNQGKVERDGTLFVNATTDECERGPVVITL
ncbi:MAG: metallophosphatase domain-containing protein [Pseudomonadota bacterium]